MFSATLHVDRITQIADFLEKEIFQKGLLPGDPYASATEIAQRFLISRSTANRVMTQLMEKGLIARKRGRGSFIGDLRPAQPQSGIAPKSIYILEPSDTLLFNPQTLGRIAAWLGIHQTLGVHSFILPMASPLAAAQDVVGGAWHRGEVGAVLAISCPREVYNFLIRESIPTVVVGSLYSDQQSLCSIDKDAKTEGFLLATHLLKKGCRKIGVFRPNVVRPGSDLLLDGIQEAISSTKGATLRIRILHYRETHVAAGIKDLLLSDDRPDSVITEGLYFANAVAAAAQENHIDVPGDLQIVHSHSLVTQHLTSSFPHTLSKITEDEFCRQILELIDACVTQRIRRIVPVELCAP